MKIYCKVSNSAMWRLDSVATRFGWTATIWMNVVHGEQSAVPGNDWELIPTVTRRPASADRTTRRHFRLLANQWAERSLIGCRAMRRSVSNAGASNAGRSLCVQMSICWYHAKGNWLRYNFATESFYIVKLCRTFRPLLSKLSKRRQI